MTAVVRCAHETTMLEVLRFLRARLTEQLEALEAAAPAEMSPAWRGTVEATLRAQLQVVREAEVVATPPIHSDGWNRLRDVMRCLAWPFREHADHVDDWWVDYYVNCVDCALRWW